MKRAKLLCAEAMNESGSMRCVLGEAHPGLHAWCDAEGDVEYVLVWGTLQANRLGVFEVKPTVAERK